MSNNTNSSNKKIVSQSRDGSGLIYEIYEDGTGKVRCSKCGQYEIVKDAPAKEFMFENWLCSKCYRQEQEAKELEKERKRSEGWAKGAAFNAAVNTVIAIYTKGDMKSVEDFKKTFEYWFSYYKKQNLK